MKKKLGNNLGLKILSFVIAILVWLFVVNVNNPIGTKSFVISDVQLLNEAYIDADGKMCMQDEQQVPIRVTIKAQRKILDRISLDDIRAVAAGGQPEHRPGNGSNHGIMRPYSAGQYRSQPSESQPSSGG